MFFIIKFRLKSPLIVYNKTIRGDFLWQRGKEILMKTELKG